MGLGSEALVRAMRDGDWDIVEGAFYTEFSRIRHVLRPVALPPYWMRFRAMDWGSARPFAVQWYAVASEDWQHPDWQVIPRGALVCYREWYGASAPNVGLKMTAEAVAKRIAELEKNEKVDQSASVADPAIWIKSGGPSIAEMMGDQKVHFRRADNARVPRKGAMGGWEALRQRLIGDEDGRPMIYWFSTCTNLIRTLPALQHDESNPEDIDTDSEDHAGDCARYAVMSRPWVRPKPRTMKDILNEPLTHDNFETWKEEVDRRRNDRL